MNRKYNNSNLPKINRLCLTLGLTIGILFSSMSTANAALSAVTAKTIQGTAPYLTFDGGTTKVTTTSGLLSITLSDGSTPAPNSLTPITLPAVGQTFADIDMLVPPTAPPVSATDPTQTINLNALIGAPYNYWGDDDGDGQGVGGITATGSLSVVITDKNGTKVNRSDMPSTCSAPYKLVLTSTAGSLSTQYGVPNSSAFTSSNATYYINPAAGPAICFAKPNVNANSTANTGIATMWDATKGFKTQTNISANYGNNFPNTGANGFYFDLDISGASAALTWPSVTSSGITATMTNTTSTSTRVTLSGPTTTTPGGSFSTTGAEFELKGYGPGGVEVMYGFKLRKWYIYDTANYTLAGHNQQCALMGYRMAKLNDYTTMTAVNGAIGRRIGGYLVDEWGNPQVYPNTAWGNGYLLTNTYVDNSCGWSAGGYGCGDRYYGVSIGQTTAYPFQNTMITTYFMGRKTSGAWTGTYTYQAWCVIP